MLAGVCAAQSRRELPGAGGHAAPPGSPVQWKLFVGTQKHLNWGLPPCPRVAHTRAGLELLACVSAVSLPY